MKRKFFFTKYLYKPVLVKFQENFCVLNGILVKNKIFYKKNTFLLIKNNNNYANDNFFLIHKSYIRTFFSLFSLLLDSVSFGFKVKLFVKGKGLRLIARRGKLKKKLYLKLGHSHKIFFNLPSNVWIKVFDRKRTLVLYSLDYFLLRNIILQIRSLYPIGLYKMRGLHLDNEILKIVKGKSR